jgi:N-acetylglucosaminyldiphosphoundecaprenol N-acetyl-beta-D-mannosaminyltransferase
LVVGEDADDVGAAARCSFKRTRGRFAVTVEIDSESRFLGARLAKQWPKLKVAGMQPSAFRVAHDGELEAIARSIRQSGAQIVFVGLGCPRQEIFVHEVRHLVPGPTLAVGAAFDYLAQLLPEPPRLIQRLGLEWAWRLRLEPRRMWRRYLLLNPAYATLLVLQALMLWRPNPGRERRCEQVPI